MDIIIDANIIRRDLKLNDKNFEILTDYLNKTNSELIYPSIVIEEVKGLYKRALKERHQQFISANRKLKSTLVTTELAELPSINIETESDDYIDFIHNKLGTTDNNIIDYKNEFLPELVRRAIERKKPLDNKGQQFRDGLLWLSLLDYALNTDEKRVGFISDNPSDFAEKGENKLCSELLNETIEKGIEIVYFRTLDDFAKQHASVIEFITEQWIEENIDNQIIESLFEETLDNIDDDLILDGIELEHNETKTGHLNRSDYITSKLLGFYVYEKADGTILLNSEWEFEAEFEVEIERITERDSSRYEHRYTVDPRTGEPEMEMVFVPDYSVDQEFDYKHDTPLFRGKYVMKIENEKVKDYDLKEWDWG